jgi:hypothetical protein
MNIGAGVAAEQAPPIVAAGFTPVLLDNVTSADLAGLHLLFVQNSSPSAYGSEYRENLAAIKSAVNAGLVLIIHDRSINGSQNPNVLSPMLGTRFILPLTGSAAMIAITRANSNTIFVTDAATLVANGPHGSITTNLSNGNFSNLGFVNLLTMASVPGRKGLLNTTSSAAVNNAVTFSYPFGQGFVIYSSIPLDMFLKGLGPAAVADAFRNIYAPNVLTYGACGLKALPAAVTAANATGHYGGTTTLTATVKCGVIPVSDATVAFTLNGTSVGSAQTDAQGIATLANASLGSTPASAIPVGSYPAGVEAAFAGNVQYGASSGNAPLTVEKAPATLSFLGGTFVYDAAPHPATGTVTGVFGESLGVPSFTYTDEEGASSDRAPVNAGTYRITASIAESANYLGTSAESGPKIRITPAPLSITADDKTKLYGAALPPLTATYAGFVGGEGTSVLGGTLQLTTEATAASPVEGYRITPSGLTSINYEIEFVDGLLEVTPAALTARATAAGKVYGDTLPDFTVVYEGFVLGETAASLDGSLTFETDATESSAVGIYPVVPKGLHSRNYTITFEPATLTVTPAPLTVRADGKSKTYGASIPALTASYEGFVLHDGPGMLGGVLLLSTDATAASHVGEYPITPSGLTSTNYTITFIPGVLTIVRAPLKIRADDKERLERLPNPLLTATYEGFVLADNEGSLDARPEISTPAKPSSPDGLYPIVVRGAADSNYVIEHIDGTLTVSPEGRMHGQGVVEAADGKHHFDFAVSDTVRLGEKGSLKLRIQRKRGSDDKFVSLLVSDVIFADVTTVDPGGKAEADTVTIVGVGRWNRLPATFEATATDNGEPGRRSDAITIRIFVGGTLVNATSGFLKSGNIQSNRLPRRK